MPAFEWNNLEHAYGRASNIPALLDQIGLFPEESSFDQEPWFTLWSSLYHQGDICSASLAVVPEIASILAKAPERVTPSFFALPASIEVARNRKEEPLPDGLATSYNAAIRQLAKFALNSPSILTKSTISQEALAIVAVALGQHGYAELVLEIQDDEIGDVLEWYRSR